MNTLIGLMTSGTVIAIIVMVVLVLLVAYIIITYNNLVKNRNLVNEAFSTMDIYLKKRWDLVPNLVEVVKGYAKHESETFEKIVSLRGNSYNSMSNEEKLETNNKLTDGIAKIMAVSENYPELKANNSFIQLNNELSKIETDIANSRKYYNGTVREYNNKIQKIPSNIVAAIFGFKSTKMIEIDNSERDNVRVNL